MSEAKKRVPKRRFKEFLNAGDWEQRKFKDIAFKRGKISEADLPYVEFEDINSGIGTLNKNILQKVGHKKGILFETGDVLFGKLRPYLQNWLLCQFRGIAVGDFWVLQPQNVSPAFLYYLIQSEAYQSVANISSGTKMPRSSWSLVSETQFSIPKYNEANMIGEFFSSIDKNITLHQRKLDKLQATKKALLQEMFPEEGQDKPKRRFKGFTDAWEQRKVNEIFKVTRGQVLAASLTTPKKNRGNIYPVYSSQTKDNGLLGYYSEYLFENAITWTTDGANAGTVNFRPGRFYSTNVNGVLINENGYACYAVSEIINKVAYKYVSKVGNPKLMNNVMAEINIMITPDIDELKQISKLIEAYNQYITLHQRKLDKLKNLKQAYLNEMFV